MQVYPSDILPLVRTFLTINGYATTVAALDKELAKNKVAIDKDSTLDLLEACRAYMQEVKAKAANGKEKRKAEDEGNSKEAKKAKVEKKKKESDSESSNDEKDKESPSGSESSSDSESDSDSSSSSSSDSDSESDSSSDSDSSDSGSDSDSESSGSESSSEEETKKAKKDKKEKKDKKDKKEKKDKKDKKEESANGTSELPTTPKSNGYHTPAVTPTGSSKKNTPFRRVTEDDVSLLDNKFADNTFESKQGDEYGRKANEILSQVRGNKFRSEKGKKKKSYRSPGVIDTRINSVKFVYDE